MCLSSFTHNTWQGSLACRSRLTCVKRLLSVDIARFIIEYPYFASDGTMQTALSARTCSCSMRPANTSASYRMPHMRSVRPFTATPVHHQTAAVAVPSPVAPQRLLVCSAAAKDATEQVRSMQHLLLRADAAMQPCISHGTLILLCACTAHLLWSVVINFYLHQGLSATVTQHCMSLWLSSGTPTVNCLLLMHPTPDAQANIIRLCCAVLSCRCPLRCHAQASSSQRRRCQHSSLVTT
jgi:hypothetical protein